MGIPVERNPREPSQVLNGTWDMVSSISRGIVRCIARVLSPGEDYGNDLA